MRAVLGPEPGNHKEVRILNQVVRWERGLITFDGDEKHIHIVTKVVWPQPDSKGSTVPRPKYCDVQQEGQELETDDGDNPEACSDLRPWTSRT